MLFKNFNILIDPTLTIFSCIGNWIILTSILYFNEQKEKIFLRNAFGRYLSPVMVEKITQNPDQLKLTGDNKIITVMFCDIRNFTKISENFQSKPKELTSLINSILDPLTKIILNQNGTIDKYMGDCIMAFWNAPLKNEKHCEDALVCSLEMIECVEKLNLDFKSKFGIEGIGIGIGINTGLATVGNMGSNIRLDYSIIGDCVNLGARLEAHSKELGVPIVIGENVLNDDYFKINSKEFLGEFQIFELDNIALKGKKEATKCYTLIPHSNKLKKGETEIHYKFLDQYYEGRFKEAIVTLTHLIGLNNYLVNYYNLMKDRCLSFDKERINNWDGITKSNKK